MSYTSQKTLRVVSPTALGDVLSFVGRVDLDPVQTAPQCELEPQPEAKERITMRHEPPPVPPGAERAQRRLLARNADDRPNPGFLYEGWW